MGFVIDTLLGYQAGDPVPSALADGGFTSILDVVNLHDDDIEALTFPNPGNNLPVAVPLAHQQIHHWLWHLNGTVDFTTITVADYDEYRITGFRPGAPLIPNRNNQNGVNGENHHPQEATSCNSWQCSSSSDSGGNV
jgi:hypothetical protein